MKTRKLNFNKAIEYFKYSILKQPIPQNNRGGFVDIIQKQVNDVGLNIKINTVDWIQLCKNNKEFYYKVLCPKLETYIKENVPYIFVKSGTKSGILKYFYIDNYYKSVGKEELKGIIRAFIPSDLIKMKDINEVYSLLEASVNFKQIDKINNNPSIINFNNGILDINTCELKQHSPDYLCTIKIPCNYVENAPMPSTRYFDSFINDFTNNDAEVKKLLLQFMGVVISNVPRL